MKQKHLAWLTAALFAVLSVTLLYGAPQMDKDKMGAEQTVTGCLQKGLEPGGFYIITADGKHWELYQKNSDVALADHVGHTVAVTGSTLQRSAAQEEKSQPYEKKEMG